MLHTCSIALFSEKKNNKMFIILLLLSSEFKQCNYFLIQLEFSVNNISFNMRYTYMLILFYAYNNMKRIQKSSMTYLQSVSQIINMTYMHASTTQSSLRIPTCQLESSTSILDSIGLRVRKTPVRLHRHAI